MKKIIITAGHSIVNGVGTGAHGFIDEGVEARRLVNKIVQTLREKFQVQATTEKDNLSLIETIGWLLSIKPTKETACVDFHFNASSNPVATGTEVIVANTSTPRENFLADELAKKISSVLLINNRGVKPESQTPHKRLGILSGKVNYATNALVEVCFVSNKKDTESYKKNFDQLAYELAAILAKYAV